MQLTNNTEAELTLNAALRGGKREQVVIPAGKTVDKNVDGEELKGNYEKNLFVKAGMVAFDGDSAPEPEPEPDPDPDTEGKGKAGKG